MFDEEETLPDDIIMSGEDSPQIDGDVVSDVAEGGSGDAFDLIDDERDEEDYQGRLEALEALVEVLQGQIGGGEESEDADIPPDDGRVDELTATIASQQQQINSLNEMLDEMGDAPPESPGPTQRDIVTPGIGLAASISNGQLSIQPDGIRRHDVRDYIDFGGDSDDGFWAKITGNTTDGTNRWKYAWSEAEKSTAGYGGWGVLTDGRSGNTAYNTIEDVNDGIGVEGNGVSPANLDPADVGYSSFHFMPCTNGNVVWMRSVTVTANDTIEYWFSYETGIDGTCF